MKENKLQDFVEHGQYSNRYYTGSKKINIFRIPIRRNRNEKQKFNKTDFSQGESSVSNLNEANTSRRSTSLSIYKGRTRGYSQKIRKHNNLAEFIVTNIESKDEVSEIPIVLNKNEIKATFTCKSNKSCNRYLFLKRRRKKVNFKKKFVDVIDVENYKQYNINEYLYDYADAKCSCLIY